MKKKSNTKIAVIFSYYLLFTKQSRKKKHIVFLLCQTPTDHCTFLSSSMLSFLPLCNLIGWYIFFPDTKKKILKIFFILENSLNHQKFSSFENCVFFTAHYFHFSSQNYIVLLTYKKKVYVRLTVYLSLVSCACGTFVLCSRRQWRHLAVARRTTCWSATLASSQDLESGLFFLKTSSTTLSTFTFSKISSNSR